jgi:GR25 family glycosyltransferase involved in LPS biosynthesis
MITKFVINLNRSQERFEKYFDDSYIRWEATDFKDLQIDHYVYKKMISYYNLNENEHRAKCACFLSHYHLLKHIVKNKLNNCLILEDDAQLVRHLPNPADLPTDALIYFGGFFHHKLMTNNKKVVHESKEGVNKLDKSKMRVLMTVSYFIPRYQVAQKIIDYIESLNRYRAIDVILYSVPIDTYYVYPSVYIERCLESQIRKNKKKHSTELYEWK